MSEAQYTELFDVYFAFSEGERSAADFRFFFERVRDGGDDISANCFGEEFEYRLPPEIALCEETMTRFDAALEEYRSNKFQI